MTKEEKIIDILKSYSTYTDRSREDECVHESNFDLIAKDITKQLSIAAVVVSEAECCDYCKQKVSYWHDLQRWSCNCGAKTNH